MADEATTPRPFDIVADMEDDVKRIEELANAIILMGQGLGLGIDQAWSFTRVAWLIVDHAKAIEEDRRKLFRALHPNREQFDKEGWPGSEAAAA